MSIYKHVLCDKPTCIICTNIQGPILCDEMIAHDGPTFKLTQRERDIAKIVIFFDTECRDKILDPQELAVMDPEIFLWDLVHTVFQYADKNSKGYTYHVHRLSQHYPNYDVFGEFYRAALYYGELDKYKQFLQANSLTDHLPTDLESVD